MKSVAVIGAGTMGLGIAQVCAVHGCDVILYDVSEEQLTRSKSILDKQAPGITEKIRFTTEDNALIADLIIEAAVEKLEVKKKLFTHLAHINSPSTVLATNTSSLSVTAIAEGVAHPERIAGLHFFNPAEKMKLVEVIAGKETSRQVADKLMAFARALGKTPVFAKDSPGFIVNRVARSYYTESLKLAEEGVADYTGIDQLLKSAGFRMGPFELMDLIGVDTNLAVTRSVFDAMGRPSRFKPSRLQEDLVTNGKFGRKTGAGFYAYAEKRK